MMNRDHLKAVVFDFDGTLAETNIDFAKMRERIAALVREWGVWDDGMGENRYVLEVIATAAAKVDEVPQRAEFERQAAQVLVEVEMDTCALGVPYGGVVAALHRLKVAGLKVGIVTRNCRACVDHFTERHPLPYDVCLTRDDVEIVKPHPAHLLEALAALGVKPEEALMVGDHRSDIECATAAGSGGIGVYHTGGTAEHFAELGAVASYPDVATFVEDLLA